MRCLDESVKPEVKQFISQKPHSIHLSTIGLVSGRGLKFLMWHLGSLLNITPGLSRLLGSNKAFTSFIISKASFPHSYSTKGAILRPVPCSAFKDPSYLSTTSFITSSINNS